MPKTKYPNERFKGKKIEIRFTQQQYLHIKELAQLNECTTSEYIRLSIAYFTKMKHNKTL